MHFCVWRCIPDVYVERDVLHVHLLLRHPVRQKLLSLIKSLFNNLFIFVFLFITLGDGSMRILLWFMSESALLIFCSKSFVVSAFIFRSLIHFKFILCIVLGSVFSFFSHVAVQFSQDHFLKRLSFVHCMFLPSFSYKLPIDMWVITGLSILLHWCIFLHFANTILSWLQFHCTIVWNQGSWCFQLLSSISALLLFRVFHVSVKI